jgi:hypothetical protein
MMSTLPQLRKSLMAAAERQAAHAHGQAQEPTSARSSAGRVRRPRMLARHGSLALMLTAGLLALAAVAYATTQLIQTGSPVKSEEDFSSNAGAGVAIPKTEGLLGIAAADPAGGPPWTMREYETSRGLDCVQVGRLVDGQIGVLGQDGAFNDDGRFHPLPSQASQAEGQCVLLDGHGHAFLGVANYGVAASGLPRQCHLLHASRAMAERCAREDPRDIYYGLLGPDALTVTYTLNGHTHTVPAVGEQGAYLIVERTPAQITAMGAGAGGVGALPAGGGTLSGRHGSIALPQPIKQITYTHGRTCKIGRAHDRDNHGGDCTPPAGYVTQQVHIPSAQEMASPVDAHAVLDQPVPGRTGVREAELVVSFTAHAPVTSALSGYTVSIVPARSGRCRAANMGGGAGQDVGRNVRAGEEVHVTLLSGWGSPASLFPSCPGVAHGKVTYTIPSFELSSAGSYGPFARRHSSMVTVGRFTYDAPAG